MKIKSTPFFLLILSLCSTALFAQTSGDYRSNVTTSGLWSDASSWERFDGTTWAAATAAPSAADGVITIQDGDSIRLTATATIDQVRIQSGGILSIFDLGNPSPKTAFTLNDVAAEEDLQVSGKLYISVGAMLTGTGSLSVASGGLFFLRRQGVLDVATTVQPSATMYIDEDPELQSTLTNNGTITWFRNNFRLANGTIINNATLNLLTTGNAVLASNGGTNLFHNTATGTVLRANSGGTFFINLPFKNEGLLGGIGAVEINSTYTNTGSYAPGNLVGRLAVNSRAFTPGGGAMAVDIADSFDIKGGNDTLHIAGSGTYDLSNTTLAITGSAYAPLDSAYTIITTSGTFSGTFKAATFPDTYGELTVNPKSVTIKKIKAGPSILVWDTIAAAVANHQVLVSWSTLQEVASTNFTVEHSLNGTDFTSIGTVPAKGNSAATSNYTFTHTSPAMGSLNYYRIRHVDVNGIITYSSIASVRVNANGVAVLITPNPVRTTLYFDVQADNVLITITNMAGQTIRTWQFMQGLHQENISNLAAGIYHVAIYQNGKRIAVQKIMKY